MIHPGIIVTSVQPRMSTKSILVTISLLPYCDICKLYSKCRRDIHPQLEQHLVIGCPLCRDTMNSGLVSDILYATFIEWEYYTSEEQVQLKHIFDTGDYNEFVRFFRN